MDEKVNHHLEWLFNHFNLLLIVVNYQTTTNKKIIKGPIILILTKEKCTFNELISHVCIHVHTKI
jgi:hypothetical protein